MTSLPSLADHSQSSAELVNSSETNFNDEKSGFELDLMRQLKSVLDPFWLMNPGKILTE
ncbi:hypothetical protein LMG24238_07693 [Paraburkholderia sediminicola]|uniref:FAD-binding oxidoreductase/transferase type 4 C-terminal domain-containing protein n=1 Tax=Paraburkholderia sediminicola TaxID=458836 RepID=A0A6J5CVN3_9BURK|nr:hypothetical protein LMG24238_07693 [Paraburkholderia sediminicola]